MNVAIFAELKPLKIGERLTRRRASAKMFGGQSKIVLNFRLRGESRKMPSATEKYIQKFPKIPLDRAMIHTDKYNILRFTEKAQYH